MQLAFWNFPPAECIEAAARSLRIQVEKQPASVCADLLRQKQVDMALLPVTDVLVSADEFDVVPGGAISSWHYPFVQIKVHRDIQQVRTLKSMPEKKLEEFMARVILKEHYGQQIQTVSRRDADVELLFETSSLAETEGLDILDIGQEWYELAQYPMVWAVYCCLKENGGEPMAQLLVRLTGEAEIIARNWGSRSSSPKDRFFGESLRLRMDDVAIAGLTVLQEYAYYYGITEELQPLSIRTPENVQQAPWWAQGTGQPEERM